MLKVQLPFFQVNGLMKVWLLFQINFQKICKVLAQLPDRSGFADLSSTTNQQWFVVGVTVPEFDLAIDIPSVIFHSRIIFALQRYKMTKERVKICRSLTKERAKTT